MDGALVVAIVKSVRASLSAIGLVLAIIASSSMTALMAATHPICTIKEHDCGKVPTIKPCCCGDQGDSARPSGPASAKVIVSVTFFPVALASDADTFAAASTHAITHWPISPPRSSPVDLPTLFASLLI